MAAHPAGEVLDWFRGANPCNVARRGDIGWQEFRERFKGRLPVVFSANASGFRAETTREALTGAYGDVEVVLASSNSFSAGRLDATLREYVEDHMRAQTLDSLANQSWYLFGDTRGPAWEALQSKYRPPLDGAADDPAVSLGVGGRRSGVSFHTHGPAYAETVHGAKRWFLAPPDSRPAFHPDRSSLSWVAGEYVTALRGGCGGGARADGPGWPARCWAAAGNATVAAGVVECTVAEGEALYIPPGWWHATLNLEAWNVFVSTFTHEDEPE